MSIFIAYAILVIFHAVLVTIWLVPASR